MATIGEQIREARKARGMTQDTLAESLKVTRQTISNYESGKRLPDAEMLLRLSEALEYRFTSDSAAPAAAEPAPTVSEPAPSPGPDPAPAVPEKASSAPRLSRKGRILLLCGIVLALAVLAFFLVPGLRPEAKPTPYTAKDGQIYTPERFKQAAENQADLPYLRVQTVLNEMPGENVDYWLYSFNYHELNGFPVTVDRMELVIFKKNQSNLESIYTAKDLEAQGETLQIPANGDWDFTGGMPIQQGIFGVGLLMRAVAENGETLIFPAYIPFPEV